MSNFVQYHNTERMGYSYAHENGKPFTILTNKPVAELIGQTVWLITGEGRPRQYALASRFIVDQVGEADHAHFRYFVRGMKGKAFVPPIPTHLS